MSRWSRRELLWLSVALPAVACGSRRRDTPTASARRVASQTVLSDEVLWDLGPVVQAQVVAVSSLVDDARYSRVAGQWPAELPRAAGTSEALVALAPTLVIIASFTSPETRRMLDEVGLETLVLDSFDGFDDYRANVRAIATAVEAPQDGERIVAAFDQRLAELRRDASDGPRVISWNEGSVPAAGTTFDDVASAAGYRNLPTLEGRTGHLQLGVEQLVAWDPEVIVVPCGADDCDAVAREFSQRPGIRGTAAARSGRVVGVPSSALYSTGSAMLDVVERLRSSGAGRSP